MTISLRSGLRLVTYCRREDEWSGVIDEILTNEVRAAQDDSARSSETFSERAHPDQLRLTCQVPLLAHACSTGAQAASRVSLGHASHVPGLEMGLARGFPKKFRTTNGALCSFATSCQLHLGESQFSLDSSRLDYDPLPFKQLPE